MEANAQIPIIELWGQLLVPLQGDVTDRQADQLRERVLQRIVDRGSEGVVIDVSGVAVLDSHLCAVLGKLAAAARLMGAHSVLCGMGPEMVMTLMAMGIELHGTQTALGLEDALRTLGITAARAEDDEATSPDDEPWLDAPEPASQKSATSTVASS
jgi:rsbT antagonist protein RsbS